MIGKLRRWADYVRTAGIANASLYAMYRAYPAPFALLTERIRHNPASPAITPGYFENLFRNVFDYASWESFGGSDFASQPTHEDAAVWFVPDWSNVWGGGHYTLFRFANYFSSRGVPSLIYVYNNQRHDSPACLQRDLERALRPCRLEVILDTKHLPRCTAAIATTWQSAYHVRAFPFAKRKLYFVQDYESQFYAYGTPSLQAMATYAFGFEGITGGGWLKHCYESHGGVAFAYNFAADREIFYPHGNPARVRPNVQRLFFYGRPSTERRCFELGMASLKLISETFPEIEIVIAGLELQSRPPFKATLMGNMTLSDTGNLYRRCDAGLAFSATNLSYLPVELMASGVPVLTNRGPQVEWHCRHGENAYLVDPTPTSVLDAFTELQMSRELRQRLVDGGLRMMAALSWEEEMRKVFDMIGLQSDTATSRSPTAALQR